MMDDQLTILRSIDLPEAVAVLRQLEEGCSIRDIHFSEFKEVTSIGSFEEIYRGRLNSLELDGSQRSVQMAESISEMLERKCAGEKVLNYVAITLSNNAVYEFWQLERGWVGWRNYDEEPEASADDLDLF